MAKHARISAFFVPCFDGINYAPSYIIIKRFFMEEKMEKIKGKRECFTEDKEIRRALSVAKNIYARIRSRKKTIIFVLSAAFICILLFSFRIVAFSYRVYIGEKYVGCALTYKEIEKAMETAKKTDGFSEGEYYAYPSIALWSDFTNENELLENILSASGNLREGFCVKISDKLTFVADSKEKIFSAFETYTGKYKNENTVKAELEGNVEITGGFYENDRFLEESEINKMLSDTGINVLSTQKDGQVLLNGENPDKWCTPVVAAVSSGFGERWGKLHSGIDIAAGAGESVLCASDGVVTYAGVNGGYGNLIIVKHKENTETYYAHLSSILVNVGDSVLKGQEIGKVGSTGNSTGPHLHFEVRVDKIAQNPMDFIGF